MSGLQDTYLNECSQALQLTRQYFWMLSSHLKKQERLVWGSLIADSKYTTTEVGLEYEAQQWIAIHDAIVLLEQSAKLLGIDIEDIHPVRKG